MMIEQIVIRKACESDLDGFLKCARLFHDNSPIKDTIEFNKIKLSEFFTSNLENRDVLFIVATVNSEIVGITGAVCYQYYFSGHAKTTQELFWWVNKNQRGKIGKMMHQKLEEWARENGSTHVMMIALADDRIETMTKLYKRAGYIPVEQSFIKEL